jgi:hypothetical protein
MTNPQSSIRIFLLLTLLVGACDETNDLPEDCTSRDALPVCEQLTAPPDNDEGIRAFVEKNSIPLQCSSAESDPWAFDIFLNEFAEGRIFILGEVHGSAEIGPASAALLGAMAESGAVQRVVLEIPMDVTDALAEYVETGAGPLIDTYDFDSWPETLFWRTLPGRVRDLYQEGIRLPIHGVEVPWRLSWVGDKIDAIAEQLSQASAELVLDPLPDAARQAMAIDAVDVADAEAYFEHIVNVRDTVCADLSGADCLRLENLARGLVLGAQNQWPDFWDQPRRRTDRWFDDRETLLYDNIRVLVMEHTDRIYAHLGAYHAAKAGDTVAQRLNSVHPDTLGAVYSVVPIAGSGSRVMVHDEVVDFPDEPEVATDVLSTAVADVYFLSTDKPGQGCIENPFGALDISPRMQIDVDAPYGAAFDAFLFFRTLSPE